ncbi:MAG: hypothetical protein KIH63_002240 [Candidatus Saccharibacteria bacterium]|nr:hypothetical protein [Candidatus Saccharibacteria bacterium]
MHRARSLGRVIPLRRVPAETIYVADEFTIPELPINTTAVHLDYVGMEPEALPIDPTQLLAVRRNSNHVRSFELQTIDEQPIHQGVDTTLKGAEWARPELRWEDRRKRQVTNTLYHGGMQREDAEAALETSHLLEEWGVHGERIMRIDVPEVLAYQGKLLPARRVVDQMVDATILDRRWKYKRHLHGEGRQPVTVVRTTPTDIRLADVRRSIYEDSVYSQIQVGMDSIGEREPTYSGMQATDPTDVHSFFAEALPYMHGVELSKLEERGYQQRFPHAGNILIDGGLVDLDGIIPGGPPPHFRYLDHIIDGCVTALQATDTWRFQNVAIELPVAQAFDRGFASGR